MAVVFAIEVALRIDPRLHTELRKIAAIQAAQDCAAKWEAYRRAAGWLLLYASAFERGCWEFFDEPEQAATTFRDWSAALVTRRGARSQAAAVAGPFRQEPGLITFTMACLMSEGSESHQRMTTICDIPESQLWKRTTFERLLRNIRAINFANVVEDTIYLVPGTPDWALTAVDLRATTFDYLRIIS